MVTLNPRRRLCLRCAAGNAPGEPSPGADVGGASPVPVQMWAGDSTTENAEGEGRREGRAPSQKTQAP